jgi:hypothetical protein
MKWIKAIYEATQQLISIIIIRNIRFFSKDSFRRQGGRGRRGRESKKLFIYYLENGNAPCYADVE